MSFVLPPFGRLFYRLLPLNRSSNLSYCFVRNTMSSRRQSSSSSAKAGPVLPRPSSSIVLLSPSNQVLLLHRVQTSTSFPSAHVFPGGNLDAFHDGVLPDAGSPEAHQDSPVYRMGAIRECFEETGLLLAKKKNGNGEMVTLPSSEVDEARKMIHSSQVNFGDWLDSINAVPDTENLIPFTRWITPINLPKRFTTQMYLYMLPLAHSSRALPSEMLVPTPDNGVEHTAATFAPPQTFLSLAAADKIILFPPQAFLLTLVSQFISETKTADADADAGGGHLDHVAQREALLAFLRGVPTAVTDKGRENWTAQIPWADKVMSPQNLLVRQSDGRVALSLEKPGPALKGSDRGGDWDRVVLVKPSKAGPRQVEVRLREDVLREERELSKAAELTNKL